MLSLTCPGCRRTLRVKDELAGKKVRCPAVDCKQVIAVPPVVAMTAAGSSKPPAEAPTLPPVPVPRNEPGAGTASPHDIGAVTVDGSRPGESASGVGRELLEFLTPAEAAGELGRLGGYRVLEVLGRGGMGVVFRAEDGFATIGRKVAI